MQGEIETTLHQSPQHWQLGRSRWWLAGVRQVVRGLASYTLGGIWQVLRRYGLRYKRGREYVHSPDLRYATKLAYLEAARQQVEQQPDRYVLLYQDECTYQRRPSLAQAYAPCASKDPRAPLGLKANSTRRIAAVLDSMTGRLIAWQRKRFDRHTLKRFYQAVEQAFPHAQTIYLVQDNWPVHFHPDLLSFVLSSRLCLLPLPTYAPWTNPIEKVWRKLKQEVLHLHSYGDDWPALQAAVAAWLQSYDAPSPDLLRYVGLLPN